jgi:hypothetical protein
VKRDLGIVRKWLERIEACPYAPGFTTLTLDDDEFTFFGTNDVDTIVYNFKQAVASGLIKPAGKTHEGLMGSYEAPSFHVICLTPSGHDFLDAVRDEGVWAETVAAVAETGGSAALELVKAVAIGFAKKKIAQHAGIEI